MRRRQSACPAGREQFSLPVVWGSPARWRVQGRSDGIFRRNCSQSPQAEGKQCPQTRRNHTGSRLRTSSRTWASACKCKWPTLKTTSHMESGLKFEPVVSACGPGGVSEIMPSLFFTKDTFWLEEIFQINFRHMVKVTFACGRLATWTRFSLNLIEIFCKFASVKPLFTQTMLFFNLIIARVLQISPHMFHHLFLKLINFSVCRTQLCINTAIVYMQRFYMFHSFTKFHRNFIAAAALFLAAKVTQRPILLFH